MDILTYLKDNILIFDGAMGTMLQQRDLKTGELPELLNLSEPDAVTEIHREYVEAGADAVTTNTFQAHELKLGDEHSVEEVVAAGVACAKKSNAKFVALDVGPLGQLLEPMGTLSFERAYKIYRRQMVAGEKSGADFIIIETMSDLYEMKAAILAAKENTSLPVFCSMTFQEDGRTFVGCDPLTAAIVLRGLGVDALGVNCSLGPELLVPAIDTMLKYSGVPVIMQANAGLPVIDKGKTVYKALPAEYAAHAVSAAKRGVRIIGGCCGTTPEHIRLIRKGLGGMKPVVVMPERVTACASGTRSLIFDNSTTVIGERLNPTGKKKMRQALLDGDMTYMATEAIAQVDAGADALDVNVGLPDINEAETLVKVVRAVREVSDAPLQIDSADSGAIEAAVRIYNGKPIINSVNGKREVMEKIFPIAGKYGALVVGLTLDENGIPETAEGRLEIARRIRDTAALFGVPHEDLLIDCLVLTVSAQQPQVKETLKAIRLVKSELGLKTVLGVSNVSFGLPNRESVNAAFLAAALGAGLDAAIVNPLSARCRETLDIYRVLNNEDKNAESYIRQYSEAKPGLAQAATSISGLHLSEVISQGRRELAAGAVKVLLENMPPLDIIDREIIPALDAVGKRFESGEIFLPQLMQSAAAVQNGFAVLKEHFISLGKRPETKGKILLATVHGDIHDIGKNIVKTILESYGYEVLDLGKDVPPDAIVGAIHEHHIRLAGLSALMTTTVKSMKDTIDAARAGGLDCEFFVGGAVLNREYADFVGAEHYARDAMEGVAIANRFFGDGNT